MLEGGCHVVAWRLLFPACLRACVRGGSDVDGHTWFTDMAIWVPLPSGHRGSARVECLKVAFIVFIVGCLSSHLDHHI